MDKYEIVEEIGQDSYGEVYKARHRKTNSLMALKKIQLEQEDEEVLFKVNQDISVLKILIHENIVRLWDVKRIDKSFYLYYEYLDLDLKKHMDSIHDFAKDHQQIKMFLYQILCGVGYCHFHNILHRDLKPQNLLIDRGTNSIKLADFGLVSALGIPLRTPTNEPGSLWYRAPELLLGSQRISTQVDVWSVGCIFAEMLNQQPLFTGDSVIDVLRNIFSAVGKRSELWPGKWSFPPAPDSTTPKLKRKDQAIVDLNLEPAAIDLLSRMLCVDPTQRITANDALKHEYFKDINPSPGEEEMLGGRKTRADRKRRR